MERVYAGKASEHVILTDFFFFDLGMVCKVKISLRMRERQDGFARSSKCALLSYAFRGFRTLIKNQFFGHGGRRK